MNWLSFCLRTKFSCRAWSKSALVFVSSACVSDKSSAVRSSISPAPTATPERRCTCKISQKRRQPTHTSNQLDQSPKPQNDEQPRKLSFLSSQDNLQRERRNNNNRIERMKRRVRNRSEGVHIPKPQRPYRHRDFNQEEGGDNQGYVR